MFGNLGNIASMMRNMPQMIKKAKEMQGRVREMQEALGRIRVEGQAGGGMVKVVASAQEKVLDVQIEQSLVDAGDREMIEDLVLSAVGQALEKAKDAANEEMTRMTSEFDLSSLDDTLKQFEIDADDPDLFGDDPDDEDGLSASDRDEG